VLDLVTPGNMSQRAAVAWAQMHLHLPHLADTTVWSWMLHRAHTLREDADHRKRLLENFSGQMTIDEIYDGPWCVIRVTDPLQHVELAWLLIEGAPNKEHVRQLLQGLDAEGFRPKLVATDGSSLYPAVLASVWPEAKHQRCVFHFIKQLLTLLGVAFWAAYKTMPKPRKRKRGRPPKRGRKRKDKEKKQNRAHVRQARWLVFKHPDSLTPETAGRLERALGLCPALKPLRALVCDLLGLFGAETCTPYQAQERRAAILKSREYQGEPRFAEVLQKLADNDLFGRLSAYLHFDNAVKTSNHAERENRTHRQWQKVRSSYRCELSLRALLTHLHHRLRPRRRKKGQAPPPPRRLRLRYLFLVQTPPPEFPEQPPAPAGDEEVRHAA